MKKIILDFLRTNNLNINNQKIVIGVSTGIDSMVLLESLQQLQKELALTIVVCHINHGQRKQSEEEALFLENYCQQHQLGFHLLKLRKEDFGKNNFQNQARNKRLLFFEKIMKAEKCQYLFLAHHLNDSMETSFMHIIRGSNLKGYAGIEGVVSWQNKWIIRPFINVLKQEIKKYGYENKITYFEDRTNEEDDYTRNRIRHYIVPPFFQENKQFDKKYLHFKETIFEAHKIIVQEVNNFMQTKIEIMQNGCQFKSQDFLTLSAYLQKEVLFTMLKKYNFSIANIEQLIKYIKSIKANLFIDYKNLFFSKQYDIIGLYEERPQDFNSNQVNIIIDKAGIYDLGDGREVIVRPISDSERKKEQKTLTNLSTIWYNSNMLPIIIRSKKQGDKITLAFGTKKVKDLLIDKKININIRNRLLLLTNQEEVLAVFNVVKGVKLKDIINNDLVIELKEK